MKRNILVAILLVTAVLVRAEVYHNIGLQIGWERQLLRLNQPSIYNEDKTDLTKQPLNGGRFGLVYELNHESGVGMFAAINYAYAWHRSAWESIPYTEDGKYTNFTGVEYQYHAQAHVLDINLQPQFKFEIAGETYLAFYTGPSFQYIAKYQAESYFRLNDGKSRYYIDCPLQYDMELMGQYYKRYNLTWGLGAAFQYECYFIRGGYDFGLLNPYNISSFGEPTYEDHKPVFPKTNGSNEPDDRLTRGRLDGWHITLGIYFWQSDK